MSINGRKIALAITADGEIELIRSMVDLLRPLVDRVIISEGNRTFEGKPREVIGSRWQELLGLSREQFGYVVHDLPAEGSSFLDSRKRGHLQRTGIGLAVRDMAPTDLLIAVDSDEFVDPEWLLQHAGEIHSVTRMKMVPLFGSLDRRAPDWHCCLNHLSIDVGMWPPRETDWLYEGGIIGPIGLLHDRGVQGWRTWPDVLTAEAAGWHLLHILPAHGDPSFKIVRQGHAWQGVTDKEFVTLCVQSGVHRSGWWAATEYQIPAALMPLAEAFPQTVLGPMPSAEARHTLLTEALERFHLSEQDTEHEEENII